MDLKWAYITFGAGILIFIIEYVMAKRARSLIGLFWLSIGAAGLVAFLTNA